MFPGRTARQANVRVSAETDTGSPGMWLRFCAWTLDRFWEAQGWATERTLLPVGKVDWRADGHRGRGVHDPQPPARLKPRGNLM